MWAEVATVAGMVSREYGVVEAEAATWVFVGQFDSLAKRDFLNFFMGLAFIILFVVFASPAEVNLAAEEF